MKSIVNLIVSSVLLLFVLDLYLLGGGRVIDFGGITLRMILFTIISLMAIFMMLLTKEINSLALNSIICALGVLLVGMFFSVINNNSKEGSVNITAYSFVILPFAFSYFKNRLFIFLDNSIRFSAMLLSSSYLMFIYFVYMGKVSILNVFDYLPESEIFLRGEGALIYKGFVFILIGALHLVIVKRGSAIFRYIGVLVCLLAAIATLTRGFVISFAVVILIYSFFNAKTLTCKYFIISLVLLLPIIAYVFFPLYFSRADSDNVRLGDLSEFINYLNEDIVRMFLGGGVSVFLGERPSIENSYMDIILRFGLVGASFLLLVFFIIWARYLQIMRLNIQSVDKSKVNWLFYSVLLLYIQSNFNPYITNYIGGTFVLFVLVYFDAFLKDNLLSKSFVEEREVLK